MRAHGTLTKYKRDHCRCDECVSATRAYELRRHRSISRPDEKWEPFVDAAPTRSFLMDVQAYGIGTKTIAELAGVANDTIIKILYGDKRSGRGPTKRVRPETERKVLALSFLGLNGSYRIPAKPTWELIDNLVSRGFTQAWIAQQLVGPNAEALQYGRRRLYASTARKVEELHRSLQGRSGPGRRSRWDAA